MIPNANFVLLIFFFQKTKLVYQANFVPLTFFAIEQKVGA